jgi:hypothetical protein
MLARASAGIGRRVRIEAEIVAAAGVLAVEVAVAAGDAGAVVVPVAAVAVVDGTVAAVVVVDTNGADSATDLGR